MKKHLNTLFIMTQGTYLSKEGETVTVKINNQVVKRLPIHNIGGIVCFGRVSCSPFLMGFCAERGVGISFLSERGRFLARIRGSVSGNVLLRREQYRRADDLDTSAQIAKSIVIAKLVNSKTVLQRTVRDHGHKIDAEALRAPVQRIRQYLMQLPKEGDIDVIRGIEGDSAHMYFSVFDHMIMSQKEDFYFRGRNRRPPMDNVNCLLSFLYTMVMHDIRSAIECVGLDPQVGFLHRDRPGRYGLALDMMEEFRPFLVDRLVLSLINRSQVKKDGFQKMDTGAVLMNDDTRKILLSAYVKRKQDEIMHPYTEEKVSIGLLFHVQAMLMARYLRGDLDGYPPFVWK